MPVAWGWIPNLTGDCFFGYDGAHSFLSKNSGAKECEKKYTHISDTDNSAEWTIKYKFLEDGKILAEMRLNNDDLRMSADISVIDKRGITSFTMKNVDNKDEMEKYFEILHLCFKSEFHKHTHHSDDDRRGADRLLIPVIVEDKKIAIEKICEQYVKKVSNYPIILKALKEKRRKEMREGKIGTEKENEFHELYILARGEFQYGSFFTDLFSNDLGSISELRKKSLNMGPELVNSIFDGFTDLDRKKENERMVDLAEKTTKMTDEIKELSKVTLKKTEEMNTLTKEMNTLTGDLRTLTWFVLIATLIAGCATVISILSSLYPEHIIIETVIVAIFAVVILSIFWRWTKKEIARNVN